MPISAPHSAQNGSGSRPGSGSSIASYSTLSSMASQTSGWFIASQSRPAWASSGARAVRRAIRSCCHGAGMALTGCNATGAGVSERMAFTIAPSVGWMGWSRAAVVVGHRGGPPSGRSRSTWGWGLACPGGGWRAVAVQGLGAVGGAGLGGAVGVQGQGPAEAVDAHVMVVRTQQQQIFQYGLAAAGAEDQVVDVASGG